MIRKELLNMTKKTDQERLQEIEEQMEKIKARKQQVESRLKEKARKERTKRLIETGALFEKYFGIESTEDAEKIAITFQKSVASNKEKIFSKTVEELKRANDEKQGI